MRHDHNNDDGEFDPSDMLRNLFGGMMGGGGMPGMPRLPGMSGHREPPPSDPDIEPEVLPTRKTLAIGDKVVLNATGKKHQKSPRYPAYGVVVEMFPTNMWLSNKGRPNQQMDIADCVVALYPGGEKRDEPVLFFYHSSSLDIADMNLIEEDSDLSMFRLPERKMYCIGDKVIIDQDVSTKFYPRHPCYGIISDVFPSNQYMAGDGTPGANVDYHDVMIRVVTPNGDTKNFAAHSSELKYFTGK